MNSPSRTLDRSANSLVIRSAVVAALGGLLFGFDTAVISGTTDSLTRVFDLSPFGLGFTVATALIGTILGALTASRPADRFGRRPVLLVIGALYFISAVGSGIVDDWVLFMVFRFIGGVGVGAASVVAPVYSAEIAPARVRGRLVGLVQLNIVFGILLAYLSNWVIAAALPESSAWRWMFIAEALPAAVFFALLFTVPESPRWLFTRDRIDSAREILSRLTRDAAEMQAEYDEIAESHERDRRVRKVRFFTRSHSKVILLAVAIATFNQLSGINAIMYFAPDIFRMAGAGDNAAFLQSIIIGLTNLVATVLAMTVIDLIGRRRLMLIGSIGYLVSLGMVAALFFVYDGAFTGASSALVLVGLMLFIAAHAIGQGSVIWVFISEIFPNTLRGRGQSLGSFTHWFFAAAISWTFPWIVAALGGAWAFTLFLVCMVGQLIWVLTVMPETKGIPLEEMADELGLPRDDLIDEVEPPRA